MSGQPFSDHLLEVSEGIARLEDPTFEREVINGSEEEPLAEATPFSLTNVYMVPGQPDPRLHKVQFRNPHVPLEAIEGLEEHFAQETASNFANLGQEGMRTISHRIIEACEEVEERTPIAVSFKTVALLAIYNVRVNTIVACSFSATDFVDALAEHMPDTPPVEEIPEEVFQDMYANESEQNASIEPYPAWRAMVRKAIYRHDSDVGKRRGARSTVRPLLSPPAVTHPVVNHVLFESGNN